MKKYAWLVVACFSALITALADVFFADATWGQAAIDGGIAAANTALGIGAYLWVAS